jgi:SAM-dependent methyltransferase
MVTKGQRAQRTIPPCRVRDVGSCADVLYSQVFLERAKGFEPSTPTLAKLRGPLPNIERDSFDAAICRLALMLIPKRHKALTAIHRALKAGARFAAIVLSTAEKEPHISESLAIARRHLGLPPAPFEDPGMFALGDPAVLRSAFERSGFRDVAVEIVPSSQRFASVAAAMEHRRNSLPEMRPFLERMSEAEREAVWKEIETVIRRFEQGDGTVIVPTERLVAVGTK